MSDSTQKPVGYTDLILKNPGIFGVIIGSIMVVVTGFFQSFTMDSDTASQMQGSTYSSGFFYAWLGSLLVLYVGGYSLMNMPDMTNIYLYLLYIVLFTFIMTHTSIYLSLNQVRVG
jgi:hypothetical protein